MEDRICNVGVRACRALYNDPLSINTLDPNVFDLRVIRRDDVTVAMFGYKVSAFENASIVVVQGSNHVNDWLKYNLRLSQVDGVQSGFDRAFREVNREVQQYAVVRPQTYFFGHSLGGAVAMLLADAMYAPWVGGVITLGQPRVFSPQRAQSYDDRLGDKTWRYVLRNDFVPFVPWAGGTYAHTKNELVLGGSKRSIVGSLIGLFPKLLGFVKSDHAIDAYVEALLT